MSLLQLLSLPCCFMPWFPRPPSPDLSSFDLLLRRCSGPRQSKQVHCRIVLCGALQGSAVLAARLVSVYSRQGLLADASRVFHGAEGCGSTLLWNSILRANLSHGRIGDAMALYRRMRLIGLPADGFTLPLVVRCCSSLGASELCKGVHGHAVVTGYSHHLHVANELILMHGTRGDILYAQQVFEEMPLRNIISWNTLLAGFAGSGDSSGASEFFRRMESEGVEPSSVSWTSLLSAHARDGKNGGVLNLFREMTARGTRPTPESLSVVLSICTEMGSAGEGKAVHSVVIRDGLEGYVFVRNSLISFYGMLGNTEEAELLFSQTEPKNLVTWNSLISCHAAAGLHENAYQLLLKMEETTGIRPNSVTWSAIIGGLVAQGKVAESLEIFRQMQEDGARANSVTAVTVLSACADIAALRLGRELHGHTLRASTGDGDPLVGNGLLSMYAKCGTLKYARKVFDEMAAYRDLISWNSMISGYGINGLGVEAIGVFEGMVGAGVDPDGVSFVAVLSACRHAGFVTEGRRLFHQMVHQHGIRPWMEHYACMVDLLGRAGLLEEAIKLVKRMPMEPNICVWGSLLNSCRMHRNDGVAEEAASRIFALELETAGSCVLLSNIYASCGRWEDSARVRVLTRRKDLRKSPGQSWIELNRVVHVFLSGALLPQEMAGVYVVLEELNQLIESWE